MVNEDPSRSAPAVLRAQATPQHAIKTKDSLTQTPGEPAVEPVLADGVGNGFGGISKASTATIDTLLPPNGIVLAAPPVPQILPSEINKATAFNRREDACLTRLYKMDAVELEREASAVKAHPLFQTWMIEEIQPEHDDTQFLVDFFNTDDADNMVENICSFKMWLETQEAEQASALLQVSQQQPALPPTGPIAAAKTSAPTTAANTMLDTPSPLLPDNQLGDSSIFPPAPKSLLATSPPKSAPPTPEAGAIKFQPVTSEGMRAFWAIMKRKSTDSMIGSPPPPSTASQVATSPGVSGVSASPVPSAKASPSHVDAANTTAKAAVAVPPTPAAAPAQAMPAAPPAATPAQAMPAAPPAEAMPAAPPAATPAKAVPVAPAAAAPTPSAATPATPAATSPSPEGAPSTAATPSEPSADDVKEARATYMRFYRSLRSAKAPAAITKTLTDRLVYILTAQGT